MNEKGKQFLSNLYADLRDRSLLPLVVALGVGIVAVPLLLKSDTPLPSALSTRAEATSDLGELPIQPAVLASNPGLRDYRKRLSALRKKNPFAQQFTSTGVASDLEVESVGPTTTGGAGTPSAAPATGSTGGGISPAPRGGDTSSSTSAAPTSSSGSTSSSSGGIKKYLIRHEIDVEIDGPSEDRKFDKVRELETLPGKKTPLLVYAGVTADEREAVFMLADDVVRTDGDGACQPSRRDCQVLTMPAERQRTLWYALRGGGAPEKYILKLHDIQRIVEPLD